MKYDPNKFQPIVSQSSKDMPYTDPGFEVSGTFTGNKSGRTMQKRPWFGHKMNFEGRIYQAGVCVFLVGLGLMIGLLILSVPWRPSEVYFLVKKGFHGPHHLVQIVDYHTTELISNDDKPRMKIHVDFFNFTETFIVDESFEIIQMANGNIVDAQPWECCKQGFFPRSLTSTERIVELASPEVDQILIRKPR